MASVVGANIRQLREQRGWSQARLARETCRAAGISGDTIGRQEISRYETGKRTPREWLPLIAAALDVPMAALTTPAGRADRPSPATDDDGLGAVELARRVQASDVGPETLEQLEERFDALAVRYQTTPPAELIRDVRRYSAYVGELMDKRATLAERRRLYVVGGWLTLLAATLHVDLGQPHAVTANLRTAALLAQHAEHAEIHAWTYETSAWQALTDGDYARAAELSRAGRGIAPRGGSAEIQATAQEGRALARMGERKEAFRAIDGVREMASILQLRARPEHHYQYDPAKASSYEATTLAWVGDPAAEAAAREVIGIAVDGDSTVWPRRVVSAYLDLALTLVSAGRLDEACEAARKVIVSGRLLPANYWRVLEVLKTVEARGLPEAAELRDAYRSMLHA